jgi:hypothetical protein
VRRTLSALRSEAGNYMITTIVGSVVLLIVIGAIAAGIVAISLFQQATSDRSDTTKQAAVTDSTFRNDVLWASSITPTDSHKVQMTVPGQDGQCKVSTWTISAAAGLTTVDVSVVTYPSFDATATPVACSGAASAPSSQNMISDADPASTFTYANPGGRGLTYTSGSGTIAGSSTAPTGVPPKLWVSPRLGAVALNTSVAYSSPRKADYRVSQTADNLDIAAQAADAPGHFIPEGDLTALP